MSDPIPFFNIIRIPEGKEDEALAIWRQISDYMQAAEGCISTRLHRNLASPSVLINNAIFRSMDDFKKLTETPEFQALSQQLTDLGVQREAGVYEVVYSFSEHDDR